MMRSSFLIIRIALSDYWHELRLSLVAIAGLTAVLAPLLVLFGLKHGIVSSLLFDLQNDPLSRRIQPLGQGSYEQPWLDTLASRDDVAFLMPTTRFLAATLRLENPRNRSLRPIQVEMVPTTAGDPLWAGPVPRDLETQVEAVISARLANSLNLVAGSDVTGRLGRVIGGERSAETINLTVVGVLPDHLEQREVMLVPLTFLEDSEAYREGISVPARGWSGTPRPPDEARTYASFRLYAHGIETVATLQEHLEKQGIKVETAAARIDTVLKLNRGLMALFAIISTLAAGGYAISMMLNLIATVARKEHDLSILKLLGFPGSRIALFPVTQALTTAIFGTAAALLVYAGVEPVVNSLFSGALRPGLVVCKLDMSHIGFTIVTTLSVALLTAVVSGIRAARILPAEGLRSQ